MTNADPHKRLRIRVDPIRCTAFGFCAEFCPELFDLDEWGYAWLKAHEVDGSAERLIRETARLCPRNAIFIDEFSIDSQSKNERHATLRRTTVRQGSDREGPINDQAPAEKRRP